MIRLALAGLGKMGLSHLAILNAHPEIDLVAACDGLKYIAGNLEKFTGIKCYGDYREMLDTEQLDAVVIATPSSAHAQMVELALDRGINVFCEKPFVLDVVEGEKLVERAESKGLITQVGYHNRFVGAFQEARRIVHSGALGAVHHFHASAYGPVVVRPQGATWRSSKKEGGGVVYDYACHALDLINFVLGDVADVSGVIRNSVFSRDVDDEVYCSLKLRNGVAGQLAANWSDESQRKMTTKLAVWGTRGHVSVDRQECTTYMREAHGELSKGWTTVNTTELTDEVWYYLRGEEYSAQIDSFVRRIQTPAEAHLACDFRTALQTDRAVALINGIAPTPAANGEAREATFLDRLRRFVGVTNG